MTSVNAGRSLKACFRTGSSKIAATFSGSRVLESAFTSVQQAADTPKQNGPALAWLEMTVNNLKETGKFLELIDRHRISGLSVAP